MNNSQAQQQNYFQQTQAPSNRDAKMSKKRRFEEACSEWESPPEGELRQFKKLRISENNKSEQNENPYQNLNLQVNSYNQGCINNNSMIPNSSLSNKESYQAQLRGEANDLLSTVSHSPVSYSPNEQINQYQTSNNSQPYMNSQQTIDHYQSYQMGSNINSMLKDVREHNIELRSKIKQNEQRRLQEVQAAKMREAELERLKVEENYLAINQMLRNIQFK